MNNGSFAKYTTAYINRPSNSQLVDIRIEMEKLQRERSEALNRSTQIPEKTLMQEDEGDGGAVPQADHLL